MTSKVTPLADLSLLITKGTTPTAEDGGFATHGVNYIKSESLSYDGSIDTTKFAFVTDEVHLRLKRSIINEGDILYSIAGANLGKCGIAQAHHLPANTNQAVAIIRIDARLASNRFVSYVLRDPAFVQTVLGGVAQSAQPNVNLGEIGRFPIPSFPLETQHAIASVLGALDDKIELNRRMNETLETVARAIFKDWFVDFGPTRAKIEGRAPYLAADIWSLFPDRLDDDGKPEGWSSGSLSGFASLNPESWTRANYPGTVDYVDLSNTKWGTIETTTQFASDDAPSRAQRILRPGDTIVGTVRPGNGSYAFVSAAGLTGSTGFAVLRPNQPVYREAVYLSATSRGNIDRLAHLADGGAYPAVRPELVAATKLFVPSEGVFSALSSATSGLIDRAEANKRENHALAATRDLLLPKLMSGEARIKEAEKLAGDAT